MNAKTLNKIRAILSLVLMILFVILVITGLGLYVAPPGRIAHSIDWKFLIFDKHKLEDLHTVAGFTMAALLLVHIYLNFRMFLSELKMLKK